MRIPESLQARMVDHLTFLYSAERAGQVWKQLEAMLGNFARRNPSLAADASSNPLTERDAILITYGDQFQEQGVPPLQTLHKALTGALKRVVSGVHILPFFPYSSDDGFSVIDYAQVDPDLGSWTDVERLGAEFRLMFDAVINHISRQSEWFQGFLATDPEYEDWFIAFEPGEPLDWVSEVVRPRALPLLTPVQTSQGEKLVWTTFSDDQIDLNYAHPAVLLRILEILLLYVEKGAQIIRLDAIAYLWKRTGTSCIHLEETHRVVRLMRCVLDAVAPQVLIITETNVPHEENISYFGNPLPATERSPGRIGDHPSVAPEGGTDEAQMVYQFPLAPLVMHSLLSGDARVLSDWAAGLETTLRAFGPQAPVTFFNFTASHDGIGLMPARGLLSEEEIQSLVDATLAHGGRVSYKTESGAGPEGEARRSVYELNISYFDALSDPAAGEPLAVQVARFVCSQAIMLSLAGVPGIYVHSLLGSRSWQEGVAQTGHNRTINRQKFEWRSLQGELANPNSLRRQVLDAYSRLLRARAADPALHPYGAQRVLLLNPSVFAVVRTSPDGQSQVLCLHNVSDHVQPVDLSPEDHGLSPGAWLDLLSGQEAPVSPETLNLNLPPYGVRWLRISPQA